MILARTSPPQHHFFGFHDIVAWNPRGDRMAALRVQVIDRPPVLGDVVEAGFVDESTGEFKPLIETGAFNFPQGARQLWADDESFWVNIRLGDDWGAVRIDASGTRIAEIHQALYALDPGRRHGYGLNFARLHRLGGYGYVGYPDPTRDQPRPERDGITRVDLETGKVELLVSIADVAARVESPVETHHYLTHLVPSPSGARILFLHRWWLPDGGIGHRLLSAKSDGTDLVCHAEGFLSHFDWWDDDRLMIWGRVATASDRLRRMSAAQRLGGVLKLAKRAVRAVMPAKKGGGMSFLLVDIRDGSVRPFWPDLLPEDGHPMFCPAKRDWLSVDTYPDEHRVRELKLLNAVTGQVVDLGRYQFANLSLDTSLLDRAYEHLDPVVLRSVDGEKFAWARSGLHCDLHPRWKADGTALAFDSTHEGSRQVYVVDTSQMM